MTVTPNLTKDDLKRLADEIASEVLAKLENALGPATAEKMNMPQRMVSWDCTVPSFSCGEYLCTRIVGCSGDFSCTIKFSG